MILQSLCMAKHYNYNYLCYRQANSMIIIRWFMPLMLSHSVQNHHAASHI